MNLLVYTLTPQIQFLLLSKQGCNTHAITISQALNRRCNCISNNERRSQAAADGNW